MISSHLVHVQSPLEEGANELEDSTARVPSPVSYHGSLNNDRNAITRAENVRAPELALHIGIA